MVLQIKALVYLKSSLNLKNNKSFLNNSLLNSFLLKPGTHDEVQNLLIYQLNNQKALVPTSMPATIPKDNIEDLARPLTLILNQSFEQDIFSEILKIVLISSIHKREDTVTVSNYRPISLLSVLRKIFEKSVYRIYYFFININ